MSRSERRQIVFLPSTIRARKFLFPLKKLSNFLSVLISFRFQAFKKLTIQLPSSPVTSNLFMSINLFWRIRKDDTDSAWLTKLDISGSIRVAYRRSLSEALRNGKGSNATLMMNRILGLNFKLIRSGAWC